MINKIYSKKWTYKDEQDQLLSRMEIMANSESEENLEAAREEILTSDLYRENTRVKSCLDNYWLKTTKVHCLLGVLCSCLCSVH